MGQMINHQNELIKIEIGKNKILASKDGGKTWNTRHSNGNYGIFQDLTDNGTEIIATTSKGLYYSKNKGQTWNKRG